MHIAGGRESGVGWLALGLTFLVVVSCGDDEAGTVAPDSAVFGVIDALPPVGRFDASLPEPPADSGMDEPEDAAMSPQDAAQHAPDSGEPDSRVLLPDDGAAISGVTLTNAPHIGFTNIGDHGLVMASAGFYAASIGQGLVTIWMYGDLENRGTENRCILSSELFSIDGGADQLVVVDADPYDFVGSESSLPTTCIPPGGRGVWHGILSSVAPTFLDEVREIRYDFWGTTLEHVPSDVAPEVLYADPVMRLTGYAFAGIIRTRDMAIHNLQISFFARDASGLIYDDTFAHPLDLATLSPNSTVFYESSPMFSSREQEPESVTYYMRFIKGEDTSSGLKVALEPPDESELGQRIARVARERRLLGELRAETVRRAAGAGN
jgi:hypothetical protein